MFSLNDKQVLKFERALEKTRKTAIPFAVRNTINDLVFDTRKRAIANVRDQMVLRNKWTEKSIRARRATGRSVREMMGLVGAVDDYLERQEMGGTATPSRGESKAIPTSYAAGQGLSARPRTRLPRARNTLRRIQLKHKTVGRSRKQRNLVAVRQAAASGDKVVYLDLGQRKGLFRVLGGKRRPYVRMLHDLSQRSVKTPKNPWLKPATDDSMKRAGVFYKRRMVQQLRRIRV